MYKLSIYVSSFHIDSYLGYYRNYRKSSTHPKKGRAPISRVNIISGKCKVEIA